MHIPFYLKKCDYCNFYSLADSEHLISAYLAHLHEETGFISIEDDRLTLIPNGLLVYDEMCAQFA